MCLKQNSEIDKAASIPLNPFPTNVQAGDATCGGLGCVVLPVCRVTHWIINLSLCNCMWMESGKNGRVPITILTTALNWNEVCAGCGMFVLKRVMASVHKALSEYLHLSLAELQEPLRIFICRTTLCNLRDLNQLSEHHLCWTARSLLHICRDFSWVNPRSSLRPHCHLLLPLTSDFCFNAFPNSFKCHLKPTMCWCFSYFSYSLTCLLF